MSVMRSLAVLATTLVLAGCGTGSDGPVATDPSETATAPTTPLIGPTWPPPGCQKMSGASIDYAAGTGGDASPEQAALEHVPEGVSVVRAPKPEPHYQRMWWVLDESGTAIAAVGMFQGDDGGWLVDSDELCADDQ